MLTIYCRVLIFLLFGSKQLADSLNIIFNFCNECCIFLRFYIVTQNSRPNKLQSILQSSNHPSIIHPFYSSMVKCFYRNKNDLKTHTYTLQIISQLIQNQSRNWVIAVIFWGDFEVCCWNKANAKTQKKENNNNATWVLSAL